MADIELVIKIPEELKNKIDNANEDNYRTYIWWFDTTLYCAIKNGTSLPKGHGDLIDRNDLLADSYCIDDWSGNEVNIVDVMTVKMAEKIIEADKEE